MHLSFGRIGLRLRAGASCAALLCFLAATLAHAGVIRGTVTDTTGATVQGATIVLTNGNQYVGTQISGADGSFQFTTGQSGRFTLAISAHSFRQLDLPTFYAGAGASIERTLVLEPEWVRQSVVVTATGVPTPQEQTTSETAVFSGVDLGRREDLISVLRLQPGAVVVQAGQRGAQTSMFIRGGDSNAGKFLFDGVNVDEMGGIFDFGNLSATGVQSAEVYRGPNSSLYGSDAASGVVNFTTPHGTGAHPILTFNGDLGNFHTARNQLELAGSQGRLDYYGAYSWFQSENALPNDRYHLGTAATNLGWQPSANLQLRGTARWGVSAVGVPNAWDFYNIADDRKQSDQNLYIGGSIDYQFTPDFHNQVRYGAARKREQSQQWYPAGICVPAGSCDLPVGTAGAGNWYGEDVTIRGANGTQAVGQALLNYSTANYSITPTASTSSPTATSSTTKATTTSRPTLLPSLASATATNAARNANPSTSSMTSPSAATTTTSRRSTETLKAASSIPLAVACNAIRSSAPRPRLAPDSPTTSSSPVTASSTAHASAPILRTQSANPPWPTSPAPSTPSYRPTAASRPSTSSTSASSPHLPPAPGRAACSRASSANTSSSTSTSSTTSSAARLKASASAFCRNCCPT